MQTLSLEHVELTNRLRVLRRAAFLAAAEALDRYRAAGGPDLAEAAEILSLCAVAHIVQETRALNRERLVAYLVNGLSLDGPGVPGQVGPVAADDRAFERLSAEIDQVAQDWLDARAHEPQAALRASWVAATRRRYRCAAWALTHATCNPN